MHICWFPNTCLLTKHTSPFSAQSLPLFQLAFSKDEGNWAKTLGLKRPLRKEGRVQCMRAGMPDVGASGFFSMITLIPHVGESSTRWWYAFHGSIATKNGGRNFAILSSEGRTGMQSHAICVQQRSENH